MTISPETKRRAVEAMEAEFLDWKVGPDSPLLAESCEHMLDAALAVIEAEAWRPIETAPQDGTHVLLSDGSGEPTHWRPLPPPKVTP